MFLLPVIDLKDHLAVQAVAGQRDQYQPVRSQLCQSPDPREVAAALCSRVGHNALYVADLDALQNGATHHRQTIKHLIADQFDVWLDAGVRTADDANRLLMIESAGHQLAQIIVALESLTSPEELRRIANHSQRLVFSLDLKAGQVRAGHAWQQMNHCEILDAVVGAGINKVIVLDVAAVGVGQGVPTADLCNQLCQQFPDVELYSGGGIRDQADVQELLDAGCHGVLVATALHRGSL